TLKIEGRFNASQSAGQPNSFISSNIFKQTTLNLDSFFLLAEHFYPISAFLEQFNILFIPSKPFSFRRLCNEPFHIFNFSHFNGFLFKLFRGLETKDFRQLISHLNLPFQIIRAIPGPSFTPPILGELKERSEPPQFIFIILPIARKVNPYFQKR